jgi:hypothetical protein
MCRENCIVDFLELVSLGSNYFSHQVWPLPRWGKLVLTFLRLDSAYDQAVYLEGLGVDSPGVISSERLLVLG